MSEEEKQDLYILWVESIGKAVMIASLICLIGFTAIQLIVR